MGKDKRKRYNPYLHNDSSIPPQPDYDEYYMFTILYVLIVPVAITILWELLIASIFSRTMVFYNICEISLPILIATAMFLYAYLCIGKCKLHKPDSMFGLYLPIIAYLLWQTFLLVMFNIFSRDGVFIHAFLSLTFYGSLLFDNDWTLVQLVNLVYYAALAGGFAAGEKLAHRKTLVSRTPFRLKYVRLIILCCAVSVLLSQGAWFYKRRNIIELTPEQQGYGFAYENGYSSTNLEPYYVENEENILARLDMPSDYIISEVSQMPVLDGAEAAYPIYSAFANACYKDIKEIQTYAKENQYKKDVKATMPIQFNNSVIAFEHLIDGKADIFFGAKPSANQQELALQAGKELILTPIGKEAFVFFVNMENSVDALTSEQIRDIYSGKITNWKKLDGANERILAFQRPENSGSQTMMEYFMGDIPLKKPVETEYIGSMGDLLIRTASYQNRSSAIGYSFRYFATIMANDSGNELPIKYLSVDGVYPDTNTIRSGQYPITTELYAVTLADNPNENVELFLDWMTSPQGQQIVSDTGYIAIYSLEE